MPISNLKVGGVFSFVLTATIVTFLIAGSFFGHSPPHQEKNKRSKREKGRRK